MAAEYIGSVVHFLEKGASARLSKKISVRKFPAKESVNISVIGAKFIDGSDRDVTFLPELDPRESHFQQYERFSAARWCINDHDLSFFEGVDGAVGNLDLPGTIQHRLCEKIRHLTQK